MSAQVSAAVFSNIHAAAEQAAARAPEVQSKPERVTLIGMIRSIFEEMGEKQPITSKDLPVIAEKTGFHPTTVRLQFYRWRAESSTQAAINCRKQVH